MLLPNLAISATAMLAQLGALVGGVVFATMRNFGAVGIAVGVYAIATLIRLLEHRRKARLVLRPDGITLVERSRERRFGWDEISFAYGVLTTRAGDRIRMVPIGEHTLAEFEELLRLHGLEAARAKIERGDDLTLFDGKLVVRPGGVERAGVFTTWNDVRVEGDDKLLMLFWTRGEALSRAMARKRVSELAVAMPSDVIPDYAIVRQLLSEHSVEIAPRSAR